MSVEFDDVTVEEAADIALEYVQNSGKCRVVTPNAEIGLDCLKNDNLRSLVNDSQLVLPDGIGVVYASKILGRPLKGRAPGVEFGEQLAMRLQNTGKSLFLFGGKPGVADAAAVKLKERYPGLDIAGTADGYYAYEDEGKIINAINDSGASVLYVCLGCPKQEMFMQRNRDALNVAVMAGLGGSLDVFSGNTQRAPDIFIKLGLEWFYRLIKEPKRIKRMARLPLYLMYALKYRGKGKSKNA